MQDDPKKKKLKAKATMAASIQKTVYGKNPDGTTRIKSAGKMKPLKMKSISEKEFWEDNPTKKKAKGYESYKKQQKSGGPTF